MHAKAGLLEFGSTFLSFSSEMSRHPVW